MPTTYLPINFICLSSEQWSAGKVTRALGPGELAFEIAGAEETGAAVYILKGDGYKPTAGGEYADYRRLRVSVPVTVNGQEWPINHIIQAIYQREGALEELAVSDKTSLVAAINAAYSALNDEDARLQTALDQAGGRLEQIIADTRSELEAALEQEAAARAAGDQSRYTKGEADARYASAAQGSKADSAAQPEDLAAAIAAHNAFAQAHADIRDVIDACELFLAELEELKAPKRNPYFSGTVNARDGYGAYAGQYITTLVSQPRDYQEAGEPAPYKNPWQPSTVRDWKDLYALTVETSGQYLIEYDASLSEGALAPVAGADSAGAGVFIEFDNISQERGVTAARWRFLYDLVMSAAGGALVIADDANPLEETEMKTDRVYGRPDEFMAFDNARQLRAVTRGEWETLYNLVISLAGERLFIAADPTPLDTLTEMKTDRAHGRPAEYIEFDYGCLGSRGGGNMMVNWR